MSQIRIHVESIKYMINKGVASDDTRLSDNYIAHLLKVNRSKLLKEKLDKSKSLSEINYTTLCMEVESADFHNCACLEDEGCYIKRTVEKIPKDLVTKDGSTVLVMNLEGERLDNITIDQNNLAKYGRRTTTGLKQDLGWFLHNGYIYVLNNTKIGYILVKGIFEDLNEINHMPICSNENNSTCKLMDLDFPIDGDLVNPLYKMTIELINYTDKNFIEDKKANSSS